MKKFLFAAILFFAGLTLQAQASLDKGATQLNAGVGFSTWGVPVYVGIDYGVTSDITVGGEFSYRSYSAYSGYRQSIIGISANGNYHFNRILNLPSEFDLYAGVSLGYYIVSSNDTYDGVKSTASSGLGFSGQVGARYFFTNNFGLNLEFGGGNVSGGKFGITYKF